MSVVWLNGELVDRETASVSVFDHGLLYGDGCFEGIRVYNGRVFKLRSHLERMYASAEYISLKPKYTIDEISDAVHETVRRNDCGNGYIRLVFTRGVGTLGLNPFLCPESTAFVIAEDITLYPEDMYEQGLPIIVAHRRRIPMDCLDPEIKSLNYLNNILAKVESINAGVLEALMLNMDGHVAECTGDNIFVIKDGRISTPSTAVGILHGITRQFVMEEIAPALGYEVQERFFDLAEVFNADELFLTGTVAEVIGGNRVDDTTIGDGKVGPITAACVEEFRKRTRSDAPED